MKILILCTGNSCRSQMAEGWFRHYLGDKGEVWSAGVETHGLNPNAVKVMSEEGIDISGHTSDLVDLYLDKELDLIITVCDSAKERCPFFPGNAEKIHINFPDPAGAQGNEEEVLKEFRAVRDKIKAYAKEVVESRLKNS